MIKHLLIEKLQNIFKKLKSSDFIKRKRKFNNNVTFLGSMTLIIKDNQKRE
ncbi:hypothetical protein GCM10022393_15820 [Aquimarina addita]|uniref:Uncharacterized protein n=1 Tax=Aquimarina addita TaxID=870485 RepID=A0ABP7XHS8_9FLAO